MNATRSTAATTIALIVALVGCSGGAGSPSPSASGPVAATEPTVSKTERPSQSPPEPSESATPSASDEPVGVDVAWTEAARFVQPGATVITDVAAWDGGFLAIGHTWGDGFIGGVGEPLVWVSGDGRSWTQVGPGLGTMDVQLRGILPLATGGVVIVGDVGGRGEAGAGAITSAAWRSADGRTWSAAELPSELSAQSVSVASGPVGHLITTGSEVWYSTDAERWQLAYEADEGVRIRQPMAGDEGFVIPALIEDERALVLASGDGIAWFEAEPPEHLIGVAPLGGDWLTWAYTDDPSTISILRSANGLDWSAILDVNDLTGPGGPKAGLGMESAITEGTLSGDGGVVVLMLGWNHCCAQLPVAVSAWTMTDGATWQAADLPADAYVSAIATDGEIAVAVGHLDRGAEVAFWVADR